MGLVVRLYDAIVEDFRRALEALRAGDIERRTTAVNHALLIIAELESVLDHERGGQVARHLKGFYKVSRAMIVEANIRASAEHMERLIGLFLPVRQAWQQAERELVPGEGPSPLNPRYQTVKETTEIDVVSSRWSG